MVLRLISVNVNGIRAAARKGGLTALSAANADFICLQEVRATSEQTAETLAASELANYQWRLAECSTAGRNGVALLWRPDWQLHSSTSDLPSHTGSGRFLSGDFQSAGRQIWVASVYVPKGNAVRGGPPDAAKQDFLAELSGALPKSACAVLAGDLNIAHAEVDLKNWRNRVGVSGFRTEEREVLTAWQQTGWVDYGREFAGDSPGPYTWWSWRGRAFDNDAGWRIDYLWGSPSLSDSCQDYRVHRAANWQERWSDHAAIQVDLDWSETTTARCEGSIR